MIKNGTPVSEQAARNVATIAALRAHVATRPCYLAREQDDITRSLEYRTMNMGSSSADYLLARAAYAEHMANMLATTPRWNASRAWRQTAEALLLAALNTI